VTLIGVAVLVPDPWGAELEAWRASFGDPQATSIPAHITVLPPTRIAEAELEPVEAHLRSAAAAVQAYEVELRGTATFRPVSPVVFVPLVAGISGCEALESAVRRPPLQRELDHPYHPHVTVAHDLPDDVLDHAVDSLAGFSARFRVTEVVLFVHGDSGWNPQGAFSLGSGT
jgi:2'-5' RNA ligase